MTHNQTTQSPFTVSATMYFRSLNPAFATLTPDAATIDAVIWYIRIWNRYPTVPEMVSHSFSAACWEQWRGHIVLKQPTLTPEMANNILTHACALMFCLSGRLQQSQWLDNIIDIYLQQGRWPETLQEVDQFAGRALPDEPILDYLALTPQLSVEDARSDSFCECSDCCECDSQCSYCNSDSEDVCSDDDRELDFEPM